MATLKKHGAHWYVKCDQCAQWTCVLDTGMSQPAIEAAAGYLCTICCDPEGAAAKWEALQAREREIEQAQAMADRALERELSKAWRDGEVSAANTKRRRFDEVHTTDLGRPPSPQTVKARISACPACKGKVRGAPLSPVVAAAPLTLCMAAPAKGMLARMWATATAHSRPFAPPTASRAHVRATEAIPLWLSGVAQRYITGDGLQHQKSTSLS